MRTIEARRKAPARPASGRMSLFSALFLAAALLSGCTKGPAYGSDNALIAVVGTDLAAGLEDTLRVAFEREVFTTRPERIIEITATTPAELGEFEKWRRILVVEALPGAILVPDLVDVDGREAIVAEVEDVWARGQTIWIVAASTPEETARLAASVADSLYDVIHQRYVERHVERMWASEPDSALAETLLAELGFSFVPPRVYREAPRSAPPDTRMYYNEEPRRIVSLHWRPATDSLTADEVLRARRSWGAAAFPDEVLSVPGPAAAGDEPTSPEEDTATPAEGPAAPAPGGVTHLAAERTELAGRAAIRLQGVWRETDGTSGGLFVTYGTVCGDRLVLLDGNLYAPERDKYPYLIQFDRIFRTFRCAAGS